MPRNSAKMLSSYVQKVLTMNSRILRFSHAANVGRNSLTRNKETRHVSD